MAKLYATPDGAPGYDDGTRVDALRLQDALDALEPGDTLKVLKGRYAERVVMRNSGTPANPITIVGEDVNDVLFDGLGMPPLEHPPGEAPSREDAVIRLECVAHVTLDLLSFDRCRPTAILIKGSQHICVTRMSFNGSRYGIFVVNGEGGELSSHISVTACTSSSDPDRDLWEGRVSWQDVKLQELAQTNSSEYRGAFFHCRQIAGNVEIKDCVVSHSFNGVQFIGRSARDRGNANIFVSNCRFAFIRDNAIEPEWYVENIWVVDCVFHNVHAAFSMDYVGGKNWYYFGNRVLNNRRPGRDFQANRGGKLYKFAKKMDGFSVNNFYSAFNSISTRTAYLKKGTTRNWTHVNNAISVCVSGPQCDAGTKMIAPKFRWHTSLRFEGDVCDHATYPDTLTDNGYRLAGYRAEGGTFHEPNLRVSFVGHALEWDGELALNDDDGSFPRSIEFEVTLADGENVVVPAGLPVGAKAPDVLLRAFESACARAFEA